MNATTTLTRRPTVTNRKVDQRTVNGRKLSLSRPMERAVSRKDVETLFKELVTGDRTGRMAR
jgi:hypothetical protein